MYKSVSVAMTSYNGDRYLAAQLESILHQSHAVTEIIIVDDASTDNSVAIIKNYMRNYAQIKLYVNSHNIGIVASFARALSLTSGDYIALADQDDVWLAHKLATLLAHIGDNYLIHSDAVLVNEQMQVIAPSHFAYNKNKNLSSVADYLQHNNATGCCMLLTRQLLQQALPIPHGFYIHDHYLALIAAKLGKITYCDQPLVYYRQHTTNSIGIKRGDYAKFSQGFAVMARSYALLQEHSLFANDVDLAQFIAYYRCIAECKRPTLSLIMWVKRSLGLGSAGQFIALTCLGKRVAKLLYNGRNYFCKKSLFKKE